MYVKLQRKHLTVIAVIATIITVVVTAALHGQPAAASLAATPIPGLPFTAFLPVFHHSPPPAPPPVSTEGLLVGWGTDNVSRQSIDNLGIYAAQGATQAWPLNCYDSSVAATAAYLDEAALQGMKVWVDMRLNVLGPPYPSEVNWKAFIDGLKAHPAVKGWYIGDEPEYSSLNRATLVQYYDWTKEADPDHPVSIAHAWFIRPEYAGPPACYDVALLNCYCGWSGQWSGCSDTADEFNASVRGSYRWWSGGKADADKYGVLVEATALGFGYLPGTSNCQGGVRDLTDAEHKWHASIPVALGYDAVLFWWDMMDPSMVQTNEHMKQLVASRFAEISAIAAEMTNGVTNDPRILVSEPQTRLIYRYGIEGNNHVILAINVARADAADNNGKTLFNVQFTLPVTVNPSEIEVLDESRTLPVINGTFTDTFTRFKVHAYAFEG